MNPSFVKHLIWPVHELLLRRPTRRYLQQLEASQWWSRQRLHDLQEQKLRRLLQHARMHCPFYARRLHDAGIEPLRFRLDDLARIPTLTKDEIAVNGPDLRSARAGRLVATCTGGSTGAPLQFWICRRRQASDQAARARTRRWFGIDVGQRELYLWGSPLENKAQDRVRAIRDRLTNQHLLDAFNMTPARMLEYLSVIRRFDPVHLFAYPSSLARLIRFAAESGRRFEAPSLKAVFVTGEVFDREDRAVIEEFVSVPVADGYGSREGGFVAHQCPVGSYHVTMESHVVELLDAEGRTVRAGETGEITLTHLDALGMPFLRYRTGDMARFTDAHCPCGRGLMLLQGIEGRRTDMLRTTAGGLAHGLSVVYVLRESAAVREFRVVQSANCDLDVAIVPRGSLSETQIEHMARQMRRRIGERADVRIRLVDHIPPDPSGKHRHVVSLS